MVSRTSHKSNHEEKTNTHTHTNEEEQANTRIKETQSSRVAEVKTEQDQLNNNKIS